MAKNPNPDRNNALMRQNCGTTRLVTDYYQENPKKRTVKVPIVLDAWTI